MSTPTRVAVLGGGAGGLAAAFELTATPELRERFEVTVHQLGWRLGGKGSSGRDAETHQRIEEHGLHVWFGFYDNAFDLVRRCYTELGADAPAHPWTEAFSAVRWLQLWEGEGRSWCVPLPCGALPERSSSAEPYEGYAEAATRWLVDTWTEFRLERPDGSRKPPESLLKAYARAQSGLGSFEAHAAIGQLLDQAAVESDPGIEAQSLWLLTVFRRLLDLWSALLRGLLEEGVLVAPGYFDPDEVERLNELDLRDWLSRRVRWPETLKTAAVRVLYDLAFAYRRGDPHQPDVAAGMAVENLFRIAFGHGGSFMNRLEGGMGDVVFAPLHTALERRGVRFEYFSAASRLSLGDDRRSVEAIEVIPQVELVHGSYRPLIEVDGTCVWPSKARWSQLADGEELRRKGIDFEAELNPLGREPRRLERGRDFDAVVLGVPVGALDSICAELTCASDAFAAMLANGATVATQALQLWLTATAPELGLTCRPDAISGGDEKPFDTLCDMSHVIGLEDWPPGSAVEGIAYLCGVLADGGRRPDVARGAQGYLGRRVSPQGGNPKLVGRDGRPGGSVDDQYMRANTVPSERYVLTPKGSTRYRLAPEESGFENLVLAGDWTRTPVNAGSVEAAVWSGRRAAETLIAGAR